MTIFPPTVPISLRKYEKAYYVEFDGGLICLENGS